MVVTLRETKKTAGRSRPKKYGFNEEDVLLHDPILYIEGLAFADETFENDIQSLGDVYDLHNQSRLILLWKASGETHLLRHPRSRGRMFAQLSTGLSGMERHGRCRFDLAGLSSVLNKPPPFGSGISCNSPVSNMSG